MPRLKRACGCGARRLPSFGSVDYRPKAGTHYVRYRVNGEDQPSKSFDTHDEACDFLEQLAIDARQGKALPNQRKGQALFGPIAEDWLRGKLKTVSNPQTQGKCKAAVAWAKRGLGERPVGDITPEEIQDYYNDCFNMAASTLTTYRVYLHQIFDMAVRKGYLHNGSPASTKLQKLPPAESRMICLDEYETDYLLDVTKQKFPREHALLHVAAHTAIRQGELFALLRYNARLAGEEPYILVEDNRRKDGKTKDTKTGRKRRVDLFPCCIPILREHLASHDSPYVFPSETGVGQNADNWRSRHWRQIVEATGFQGDKAGLHFHDLRHTHISQLLMRNWPVLVVAQRAGHASPKMTLDVYGHVIPGSQRMLISQTSSYGAGPGDAAPPLRVAE